MKMSVLPAAGSFGRGHRFLPPGVLKIIDIFRFFLEPSRNHSGAPLGRQSEPKGRPRCQNGAPKLTFGPSGMTFSVKIRDSGTLLEHWYLPQKINKNKVRGRTECVWNRNLCTFGYAVLIFLCFYLSVALPGRLRGGKWSPRVPQGLPKETLKSSKIDEKSTLAPPWGAKGYLQAGNPFKNDPNSSKIDKNMFKIVSHFIQKIQPHPEKK